MDATTKRSSLECGILAHGFARIYCENCKYDQLVAFSCKRRGFCGSCMAKRMNETAAHLVDSVIPRIPTRQWVLSVPAPLRHLISFDSKALKLVVDAYSRAVFSWLKKKAKHRGIIKKASEACPGAVTFIQRFGSSLNLNTHFHSIFSDGIYTKDDAGELTFHRLPGPTLAEVREIAGKIAKKVHRWLEQRMQELEENNEFAEKEPLLAKCYAASSRNLTAMGPNAGQPLMRVVDAQAQAKSDREERTVAGFNLHISLPIGGNDRAGLERQLRYMGRPPLSEARLTQRADGRIVVKLKSPWRDGTSHIVLTPLDFLARLVALIPPPRKNQIRYFGIWAPNAKLRKKAIPEQIPEENTEESCCHGGKKGWAKMLARIFAIDILTCPRCQGKRKIISFITESKAIKDILDSVGMSTAPPEIAKAAFVAEQTEIIYNYAE